MDELIYNSLLRYFTHLTNYGYKSEGEVEKLLVYTFILELVNDHCVTISEEDYRSLENALYCLYGTTCLIPYPDYCNKRKKGCNGRINANSVLSDSVFSTGAENWYVFGDITVENAAGIEVDDIDYS